MQNGIVSCLVIGTNVIGYVIFPYFIFMGNDISKLLPRRMPPKSKKKQEPRVIPFHDHTPEKPEYSHRCTVCGRTDVTNPELEFRYCSRCNGYHCYCEDHISNHTHIE